MMGHVPNSTAEDINKAMAAAQRAFDGWPQTPISERADYLARIAANIQTHIQEIATTVAQEVDIPIKLSDMIQAGLPLTSFQSMSQIVRKFPFEEQINT